MTVSRETVPHLDEMVDYLLRRFSPQSLHMEPLFSHGRAQANGLQSPDAYVFVENFRKALDVANRFGMDIYYSGARVDEITDTFCGVPSGSFNVTPEGLLTSCYEVCHPEDELADEFFYGGLNEETGQFEASSSSLKILANHTVRERPECGACYCKWHCAGDCIAKNLTSDRQAGADLKSARCTINQELSRDQLVRRLRDNSRVMTQVESGRDAGLIRLGPTVSDLQTPPIPDLPVVDLPLVSLEY